MRRAIQLGVVLPMLLLQPCICAASNTSDPGTFKGVKAIQVIVEGIKDDAKSDGLLASDIQTQAELHLRSAGVKVPAWAPVMLDITISTLKSANDAYVFSLDVSVIEPVQVRGRSVLATTWSNGTFGYIPKSDLVNVSKDVANLVDKLANEWLRDNPR